MKQKYATDRNQGNTVYVNLNGKVHSFSWCDRNYHRKATEFKISQEGYFANIHLEWLDNFSDDVNVEAFYVPVQKLGIAHAIVNVVNNIPLC